MGRFERESEVARQTELLSWQSATNIDIAIDPNGALHAVYYDGDTPGTGLKYAFSQGDGTWTNEFLAGGASYVHFAPMVKL